MNREIKFRAWDGEQFLYLDLNNVESDINLEWLLLFFKLPKQQYLGELSYSGNSVYCGDIITDGWVIYWSESVSTFCIKKGKRVRILSNYMTEFNFEVIGNIFENPELLEN